MLKLKRHFLNSPVAMSALSKLYKEGKMEPHTAYRIGKIYERTQDEARITGERAIEIHKKYCLIDPSGMPSGLSTGKLEFTDPSKETEHDAEFVKLLDEEFEEKVLLIDLENLPKNLLTPEEITSLLPILSH